MLQYELMSLKFAPVIAWDNELSSYIPLFFKTYGRSENEKIHKPRDFF